MNLCVVDWSAIFTGLEVAAELIVAGVIFYEFEGGRLDRFLEDADKLADERRLIYCEYCDLQEAGIKARGEAFASRLQSNQNLQDACHQNIRLLSRIGARLPHTLSFKRVPLEWHVAAEMWMILASYVEGRRREAGPSYANSFIAYALASTNELLGQNRDSWTLRDPDPLRRRDVTFTRQEMLSIRTELKDSLKRRY